VGLKHDSTSKDKIQVGKLHLHFHHAATASQTLGTEFVLEYQKRVLEARLGYLHKFNADSSAKFKVNHHGYLDAVFKHRVSSAAILGFATGFNLKNAVAEKKGASLPFGLSLDLKF
jgi:hypothetical protein